MRKKSFFLGRWVAKLVAHLLATASLGSIQTSLKMKNGRHKQRSGQHTLACQKPSKFFSSSFLYSTMLYLPLLCPWTLWSNPWATTHPMISKTIPLICESGPLYKEHFLLFTLVWLPQKNFTARLFPDIASYTLKLSYPILDKIPDYNFLVFVISWGGGGGVGEGG